MPGAALYRGDHDRSGPLPPRAGSPAGAGDGHLGRRPRGRAAGHLRGPAPGRLADRAPRIVETPEGHQVWEFEGQRFTQVGMNAVAGRRPETYGLEPFRFDQMRPGLLRHRGPGAGHGHQRGVGLGQLPLPDHRLLRAGLLRRQRPASSGWPASGPGTTGSSRPGTSPTRTGSSRSASPTSPTPSWPWPRSGATPPGASPRSPCPSGRTRSACRRCGTARTGTPSSTAIVETDTVVSLHVGSSGMPTGPAGRAGPAARGHPVRPAVAARRAPSGCGRATRSGTRASKIAMSEGGIGWVAMLLDRLDNMVDRSGYGLGWDLRPAEVLQRNFWFCTHRRPVDHRHPPPDRGREHHGRGRLPPR